MLNGEASCSAINVDIYDGPTLATTVPANQYRSDVGNHAFTIYTPASLKNSQYPQSKCRREDG
jgi:hypothetical protein